MDDVAAPACKPTNMISPMMSFFALIVAFFQKYDAKAGIGTVIATMLPYTIAFTIGWMLLLVIWQIPHFWLVVLSNKRDYEESALPNLANLLSESRMQLLTVLWVCALVTVLHTILAMTTTMPATIRIMISAVSLIVLVVFSLQMCLRKHPPYRFLFMLLNSFMLLTMALLTVGAVVA